jgi:hypothetical protein
MVCGPLFFGDLLLPGCTLAPSSTVRGVVGSSGGRDGGRQSEASHGTPDAMR